MTSLEVMSLHLPGSPTECRGSKNVSVDGALAYTFIVKYGQN